MSHPARFAETGRGLRHVHRSEPKTRQGDAKGYQVFHGTSMRASRPGLSYGYLWFVPAAIVLQDYKIQESEFEWLRPAS